MRPRAFPSMGQARACSGMCWLVRCGKLATICRSQALVPENDMLRRNLSVRAGRGLLRFDGRGQVFQ